MTEPFSLEQIRDFWTQKAREHGLSPSASWSDRMVIEMEIREILARLGDGDNVLDIGCANGFSTIQFASQKRIDIRGLDYIPEMIAQARTRLESLSGKLRGIATFDVGNITSLNEPDEKYDKVIVIRVVINLGEWSNQLKALRQCARVLKPGGLLLLSEATLQGWRQMNKFRCEWGLPEIPMPPFNNYLDERQVIESLARRLDLIELSNFSSTYFVGTRVIKPLLARALGGNINVADPEMEWNRFFSRLPAWGDYGTQKLFVFRKR
jgi:ubiquinone/menaquinone biosynthesis C-methylase UbiE